ncbi:MAG: phosphonate metabolism protein/1,5-bisphosphokinase (PRPP-forming) PhnN [Actinomycetota bacterium]
MASGAVVYVVGPSGAGKDSVLRGARDHLDQRVRIAVRTITRPPSESERNREVSPETFAAEREAGRYALSWEANGHRYGIGTEIDDWLDRGAVVVVNGSRAHLPRAAERYGDRLHPLLITAEPEVLAARLAGRGRETAEERLARLQRSDALGRPDHERLHVIDNSGALDDAVAACVDFLAALGDDR